MLSVLIPFYNWDVSELIDDLLISSSHVDEDVEVIVCDDCSADATHFHQLVGRYESQSGIHIIRNEQNIGRSRTRNKLVGLATYEHIIFIDGDSRLHQEEAYLANYVSGLYMHDVMVGGTLYDEQAPSDRSLRLHWNYGRVRENRLAFERNKEPLRYFFSNNFKCTKALLLEYPFDEGITGYGYEDTLWAANVSKSGTITHHIDNCVIHKGLKNNIKFLKDADEAVLTLTTWFYENKKSNVKLLTVYHQLQASTFGKILLYLTGIARPLFKKMLECGISNLRIFDLYRLGSLHVNLKNKLW